MRRLAIVGLWVWACLAPGAARADSAWVRFAHGWLHDTALNVELEDSPFVDGLGFGQVTDYLGIEPTNLWTSFCLPGGHGALWRRNLTYAYARRYTVLAYGDGARPLGAVIEDDVSLPREDDQVRLRLVGASNRLGTLAAEVAGPGGTFTLAAFKPGEGSAYLDLPAGPYQVRLHRANKDGGLGPRLKTFPPVPLSSGCVYSGFAFGAIDVAADNPRRLQLDWRLDAAPEA